MCVIARSQGPCSLVQGNAPLGFGIPLAWASTHYPNTPHWSIPSCPGVAQRGDCASLPWVFRVARQLVGATPTHACKTPIMPPWAKWLTATAWRCPPHPAQPGVALGWGWATRRLGHPPLPCHDHAHTGGAWLQGVVGQAKAPKPANRGKHG